jgi:hypothetical protein
MKYYEILGTYGSQNTKTTVLIAEQSNGKKYYTSEGGKIVNITFDEITEGASIEPLNDIDCFTMNKPINNLTDLENAINS